MSEMAFRHTFVLRTCFYGIKPKVTGQTLAGCLAGMLFGVGAMKSAKKVVEGLTAAQVKELVKLDARIEKASQSFVDAAEAVFLIKEGKLYIGVATGYIQYCELVHQMDKSIASRLYNAGNVMRIIRDAGETTEPVNEGQCRALAKHDQKRWLELWRMAVATGEKITAKVIDDLATANSVSRRKTVKKSKPQYKGLLTAAVVPTDDKDTVKALKRIFGEGLAKTGSVKQVVTALRTFATWLSKRGETLGIESLSLTLADKPVEKPAAPSPK
jgi:hypothetical protein